MTGLMVWLTRSFKEAYQIINAIGKIDNSIFYVDIIINMSSIIFWFQSLLIIFHDALGFLGGLKLLGVQIVTKTDWH
jgi:hypothetical protein